MDRAKWSKNSKTNETSSYLTVWIKREINPMDLRKYIKNNNNKENGNVSQLV